MNILQYFHVKETLPMFNIGDQVRLRKYSEEVRLLYNMEYPNCAMTQAQYRASIDLLASEYLGWGVHIVSGIEKGTPAAGGWFVGVDNNAVMFHGNIFELI
jgi:hypothetical protein